MGLLSFRGYPQAVDSLNNHSQNLRKVLIIGGVTYGVSLYALNKLWYADFDRGSFHFFNDNPEWLQMDKAGHMHTSFNLTHLGYQTFAHAGYSKKRSLVYGGVLSLVLMTPIEIFDGFSMAYGASPGDIIANLSGTAIYVGQILISGKRFLFIKYSFVPSPFAAYRPNVLGKNQLHQLLKDYNGQTYWASINLPQRFAPQWLNLALGYGGEGMVHARTSVNTENGYHNYRQWYLSLDFDFSHLSPTKRWQRILIALGNMIHLPAPALEISQGGLHAHWLKF